MDKLTFFISKFKKNLKIPSFLKIFLSQIVYYSGLAFIWKVLPKKGFKAGVIMYHDIKDKDDCLNKEDISFIYFRKQVLLLKKFFPLVSLDTLPYFLKEKSLKRCVVLTFDDGFRSFLKVENFLRNLKIRPTLFVSPEFLKKNEEYLNIQELLSLVSYVEVGAHGLRHICLSDIEENEKEKEIFYSRKYLEQLLGRRILSFSYPRGLKEVYSPQLEKILGKNGFICAVTTREGIVKEEDNVFFLNRLSPRSSSPLAFLIKLLFLLR